MIPRFPVAAARRMAAMLALWAAVAGPQAAAAQERLTPDQFMDAAEGNTLVFRDFRSSALIGVEQFLARDRSVWARSDGTCTYGEITLDDLYICFAYEDDGGRQHCWVPFRYNGMLLVRSRDGEIQKVTDISQRPVLCTDVPVS